MNEEMTTYEELENTEAEETHEEPETSSGSGILGKILLGTVVAGAVGVGTYLYNKTKDKREAKKIEKLRKKGYVIYEPEEATVEVVSQNEEDAE